MRRLLLFVSVLLAGLLFISSFVIANPVFINRILENSAPYKSSIPHPLNGSINISPFEIEFGWNGGDPDLDDAVEY